ncbi:MAG: triose-phosphate isomerase, partial [Gemmataceae bacterium]|nr:triose-phosphate isomerase [Gemmataceae bacterium]
ASAIVQAAGSQAKVLIALCPPFPYLANVARAIQGSRVVLGAQNLYPAKEGAFTGEVSPAMLVDVGCQFVILGHSERRQYSAESDAFINRKTHAALAAGLKVILCIGETLKEREDGYFKQVVDFHLSAGLVGIDAAKIANITIAYEPVWAIGTGKNATPEQAQEAHVLIRQRVAQLLGQPAADKLTIQYGGSVKPDNAASLLSQPDVDGALVGGASLKADQFLAIVQAGS